MIAWLQRSSPELFDEEVERAAAAVPRAVPRLAAVLGIMVLLSPLGLWLPQTMKAGSAWGEWSADELKAEVTKTTGDKNATAPAGLVRAEEHGWKAPLPDYNLPGQEEAPLSRQSLAYILSGATGVLVVGGLLLLLRRVLAHC